MALQQSLDLVDCTQSGRESSFEHQNNGVYDVSERSNRTIARENAHESNKHKASKTHQSKHCSKGKRVRDQPDGVCSDVFSPSRVKLSMISEM